MPALPQGAEATAVIACTPPVGTTGWAGKNFTDGWPPLWDPHRVRHHHGYSKGFMQIQMATSAPI